MHNPFCILFTLLLCLSSGSFAQNKRALLIGINDYYKLDPSTQSIVRDAENSLRGCINDAKSIRELLLSRFSFKASEISEIYNKEATQDKILSELDKLLAASKSGDIVFFYYSGHGIQLKNPVTKSTDEAIAPSDIMYKRNGFIKTLHLASVFNKFVDKNVTLTTVFDCCHSWGTHQVLGRNERRSDFNFIFTFNHDTPGLESDFSEFSAKEQDVEYNPDGSFAGRNSRELDFNSYFSDYIYTEDTLYTFNPADSTYYLFSFSDYFSNTFDYIPDLYKKNEQTGTYYPARENNNDIEKELRFQFNLLGETSHISQQSPSMRQNSNYLFMSATNDNQKAKERPDENGNRHGVFTKALLEVYKKFPATISVRQLFDKINAELKKRYFTQTPTLKSDPKRTALNLAGIPAFAVRNTVIAKCTKVTGKKITLDKGKFAGIAKGNILQDITAPGILAEVTEAAQENFCTASIIKGSSNVTGHQFKVTDWNTKTDPLLKVYIPQDNYTVAQFTALIKDYITPLVKEQDMNGIYKGYGYYVPYEENFHCSKVYIRKNKITYTDLNSKSTAVLADLKKKRCKR
jgi:hypothetical protein